MAAAVRDARGVHEGPEAHDGPVLAASGLEPLEHRLPVVQHRGGRFHRDGTEPVVCVRACVRACECAFVVFN